MSISVCLLTRNQEPHIERCLGSLAGLDGEVIVGDTGSTDGTVSAAQRLGAKVVNITWHDDFAEAQNLVLAQASGDWVLWLNPDEELESPGAERILELITRPEAFAYALRVREIADVGATAAAAESLQARLFRRHAELRYVGRLHPHLVVPLEELARRENKRTYVGDVVIRRHAYLSVLTPAKLRWATRLLELELRDRPGQLHYLIEYGRNLLRLNDPQGHAVLADAADLVLAAKDASVAPSPTVASLLEYIFTVSAEQSRSRLTPSQARELTRRWFANSPPPLWAWANAAFAARDYAEAARIYDTLIHLGRTGTYDRSAAFDPAIMGEAAMQKLQECQKGFHRKDAKSAKN